MTTNSADIRVLDQDELDLVSGGDKNAKGKPAPPREKAPETPPPYFGPGTIIRIQF